MREAAVFAEPPLGIVVLSKGSAQVSQGSAGAASRKDSANHRKRDAAKRVLMAQGVGTCCGGSGALELRCPHSTRSKEVQESTPVRRMAIALMPSSPRGLASGQAVALATGHVDAGKEELPQPPVE